MRPGTTVTMVVTLPDPRRMRYETFSRNRNTPPLAYNKQGRVIWVDWKNKTAAVRWTDGTTSKVGLDRLTKATEEHISC